MPLIDYYGRRHSQTLLSIAKSVRADTARTLNARNAASLYCLPAELIWMICEYLPIAETFCLMICCARFWNSRTGIPSFVKVRQLICPPRLKQPYRHDLAEIRFYILRLEFDKTCGIGDKSLCCWACMRTHYRRYFCAPQKPVNLRLSVEEQRVNCSYAITRSCIVKCRRIWVGICYEMSYAELRTLQLGKILCEGKAEESITIPGGRCFSERIELNLKTKHISSRFYLGRLSDFGLDGFRTLCKNAMVPICPHHGVDRSIKTLLRCIEAKIYYICTPCNTRYTARITSDGFIEVHVSYDVGFLGSRISLKFRAVSYGCMNRDLVRHFREFADWLNKMYHPETGALYNGGQFEMFTPTRIPSSLLR